MSELKRPSRRRCDVDMSHLMGVYDRGDPLLRIFLTVCLIFVVGLALPFLVILSWLSGFVLFSGIFGVAYWFRLKLS